MSQYRFIGGVVSVAFHAAIIVALALQSPPRMRAVDKGNQVHTFEVSLVPGDRSSAMPDAAEEAPAELADAHQPNTISGVGAPSAEKSASQPSALGPSGSGATAPAFATYASSASYSDYQHRLLDHIRPHQFYPDRGRVDRLSGVVYVGFAVQRDGKILEIWVETSSGQAVLDQAALDTVRRAQPMPLIPSVLPDSMDVVLPIGFSPPRLVSQG